MKYVRAAFDAAMSVISPRQCRVCFARECDLAGGVVCEQCWAQSILFSPSTVLCRKCGTTIPRSSNSNQSLCGNCSEKAFDSAFACGVYDGALESSVLALKEYPHLAKRLKQEILHACSMIEADALDIIIPVPLSKRRAFERGFNQAEVIASHISRHLVIPLDAEILTRVTHTPFHRAGMDERARELTVEKAFGIADAEKIRNKNVLLVDDVMTSGATASACSSILKKNGARTVIVFTIARAVNFRP